MNKLFKIAILVSLMVTGAGIKGYGLPESLSANTSLPANQSGSIAGNPALDIEGPDRLGVLWEPFLEWEIDFPGYEGNPFDLEARVVFTHERSGEKITTGMFYDGGNTWRFRFTGTRTGLWTFESISYTEALNGYRGRVVIEPNPDLSARGFISSRGNKFIRQGPTEHDEDAFIPNVWINYRKWGSTDRAGWTGISSTFADQSMVEAFLDDARSHGMNGVQAIIANQWFTKDVARWDHIDNENPDPETFLALENAIIQAHKRGMFIHIWMWGDEERRWTPAGLTGGINGEADRRVQRYLAARLGPLPGWTMGKGFDLMEWTTTDQVAGWVDYLQEQSGWPRLLGGREERTFLTPGNTNYLSHDLRMDDNFYSQASELIDYASGRPVWLTRRFTWMRDNVWDVNTTRRALWQFAMAGGVGAIWGHFPPGSSPYKEGEYDKEQLNTYSNFWRGRFLLEMEPANDLSDGALVLSKKGTNFVFYKEDAGLIQIDLSSAAGPLRAIAIDTRDNYKEIDIGIFDPAGHRWVAPYNSDWALAVGNFGNETTGKAENRLRIYRDNPRYLEYNGDPVVIASKTFGWTMPGNVFFDHAKDIKTARDNGGNFLRITLFWPGQGNYYEFALPWKKDTETGLYDLGRFNDLYFDRLHYVLSLARHHDMIVNLEIWDTPAVKDRPTRWPDHPMNPVNNINYDEDQLPSGSAEQLFFRTLQELDDKPVALHYQQKLLEKILEVSLPYGNIIYSLGNEDRAPEEWRQYWSAYIRDYAHRKGYNEVLITNMADEDNPVYDVIDTQDTRQPYRVRRSSPPELREAYRRYSERDRIKPVFDSAQMIADNMQKYYRPYYHLWVPFLSGGAGVRFHRAAPYPATMAAHGGGFYERLGEMRTGEYQGESFREHPFYHEQLRWVRNFRNFTDRLDFWTMDPLWDIVTDGEAYGSGRTGEEYMFYVHESGSFTITGHGMSDTFEGYWYNPDTGEASGQFTRTLNPDQSVTFDVPGSGAETDMVLHLKKR